MQHKLILFDIDGTILLTRGAGVQAMVRAGRKIIGEHFSVEGYDTSGMLDPIIYAELAKRHAFADHAQHHDRFREAYIAEMHATFIKNRECIHLLPGVGKTLEYLRSRDDVMLGLLSGNYRDIVPIKFAPTGIDPDWFPIKALGDEGLCRPDLTLLAMQRYEQRTGHKARPENVFIIGDTPKDIACAHAHDCKAIAVTTGRYTTEELIDADLVLNDLTELDRLIAMIGLDDSPQR